MEPIKEESKEEESAPNSPNTQTTDADTNNTDHKNQSETTAQNEKKMRTSHLQTHVNKDVLLLYRGPCKSEIITFFHYCVLIC